jgi:hypothetical protein
MVNERWVEYENDNARRNQRDDKAKDPPLQLWAAVVGKGKAQERWQDKEQGKTHMPPLTAAGAGIPSRNDRLMDRLAGSLQFAAARQCHTAHREVPIAEPNTTKLEVRRRQECGHPEGQVAESQAIKPQPRASGVGLAALRKGRRTDSKAQQSDSMRG